MNKCTRLVGRLMPYCSCNLYWFEIVYWLMDRALKNLARLPMLYEFGDSGAKGIIVSSMFPEKLTFDGEQHRTVRVNEAIGVFDSVKAVFEQKKDRKTGVKSDLRSKVTWERLELSTH